MVVIDGVGGYVPLYRIDRADVAAQHGGSGSGETAVPGRDENHVTMASEAAETALARSDIDGADLDGVFTASTTDPFAEHGIAAHVAYRHGATGDVRTGDFSGSVRAATDALVAARDHVTAHGGDTLVVGVDIMPAASGDDDEAIAGAGAGAVVVSADTPAPAATVDGVGQSTTGFVERHRKHGEPAETGDPKFESQYQFEETVAPALERATDGAGSTPTRFVAAAPNARTASAVGRQYDDVEQVSTFDAVGFAGAASFFIDLAHLVETTDTGESILAVAAGAGGADSVSLVTGPGVDADVGLTVTEAIESKEYVTYAKHHAYRDPVDYQGVKVP